MFYKLDNLINDTGISELFNHFSDIINLKKLYIKENKISDDCLESIIGNFHDLMNLEVFDLSNNHITDEGYIYLSKNISICVKLKELNIYSIYYILFYILYYHYR